MLHATVVCVLLVTCINLKHEAMHTDTRPGDTD